MSDDSEHLDEFGDVPAVELAADPLAIIPDDELKLIGEIVSWTAYIEADLFLLFLVAYPGEAIRRRKQFYKQTVGLYSRARLVRQSFEGRADVKIIQAIDRLIEQIDVLGKFRNDVAHNPIIQFGPKRALVRWTPGSGAGAGHLTRIDAKIVRSILPTIRQLHDDLRNLAALLHSPSGTSFGIVFGERDARAEAQINRYIAAVNQTDDEEAD